MESQPQNTEFRINPENFHPSKKHGSRKVLNKNETSSSSGCIVTIVLSTIFSRAHA